jgi:hypothetical protein
MRKSALLGFKISKNGTTPFRTLLSEPKFRTAGWFCSVCSLNTQGHPIGLKLLDLLLFREPPRSQLRPLNIIALLQFIHTTLWKHLFNRPADALEKSAEADKPDEYMIHDNEPLINQYISVPKEMNQLNCAAFVAGIVEGVCDGAGFPARVTAHSVGKGEEGELWPGKTVFLIKFQEEVVEREQFLGKGWEDAAETWDDRWEGLLGIWKAYWALVELQVELQAQGPAL